MITELLRAAAFWASVVMFIMLYGMLG